MLAFAGWIAVADDLIARNGQPIGTDFSNVYAAGTLTCRAARQTPIRRDHDLVVLAIAIRATRPRTRFSR